MHWVVLWVCSSVELMVLVLVELKGCCLERPWALHLAQLWGVTMARRSGLTWVAHSASSSADQKAGWWEYHWVDHWVVKMAQNLALTMVEQLDETKAMKMAHLKG